ncbi:DNA polymerase III epsilon subunit-like protein [Actinoplanes octamycinicus]|uniref:DNA polymerase III epsilon subunit-like protein n=1 Tax=Actinoplanes octamycinicus TaxID=135948 RepID=A0A7W7H2B3_9ACTN|nr:exonuclease domain-containing protein [Actinoplanes octamycinicus]MBB4742693.1 DNA polymerase III epsilon subunit-like protein [Actinoplanes octamycinicus]
MEDHLGLTDPAVIKRLTRAHREDFASARPRIAVPAPLPDRQSVYRHYEQHALQGVRFFDRAGRARARQTAADYTDQWIALQQVESEAQRAAQQAGFDDQWRRLASNDQDTVLGVLASAFDGVPAYVPVAIMHVDDDRTTLALVAATDSALPAGLTGVQRAQVHTAMVKSHSLAAVRQTFALAPGIQSVRAVVVRNDLRRPCILAFSLARAAIEHIRWDTADADEIIEAWASHVCLRPEPHGELGAIDDLLDEESAELARDAQNEVAQRLARQTAGDGHGASGFAVIDVETSGLSPEYDRVIEVAVVATDSNGNVVDEWTTLVNPEGPVGKTSLHRITAADVADAPRFTDIVGELTLRLAGRVIVGHNVQFDLRFLHAEFARARLRLPHLVSLCTYRESHDYLPGLQRRRLPDCCHAAGVVLTDAHAALEDARATAGLLRIYLGSGHRRAAEHRRLPAQAAQVPWPQIPQSAVVAKPRPPAVPPPIPAPAGALAALLEDLPVADVLPDGAPPSAAGYLELLAEALDDGVLTEDEAAALADHARFAGLSRTDVDAAHEGFVLALARQAVADGRVTMDERRELNNAAAVLGLPVSMVKRLLSAADAEWLAQLSRDRRPLPPGWTYGEPLRVGDKVAFTGGEPNRRERLEIAAQAAGLRVMNNVSRLTAVLVTPEARPESRKGEAAGQHGTRILRPGVFEQMLAYVQPAALTVAPPEDQTAAAKAVGRDVPGIPASPAVMRAWARQNGYVVGPRGRLPQEVQAAYQAALDQAGIAEAAR